MNLFAYIYFYESQLSEILAQILISRSQGYIKFDRSSIKVPAADISHFNIYIYIYSAELHKYKTVMIVTSKALTFICAILCS